MNRFIKKEKVLFTDQGILLSDGSNMQMLHYNDILYCYTDRPYAVISTNAHGSFYVAMSLVQLAGHLPAGFCFCSQSAIVNLLHVGMYEKHGQSYRIRLNNGDTIHVSRRFQNGIKSRILPPTQRIKTPGQTNMFKEE